MKLVWWQILGECILFVLNYIQLEIISPVMFCFICVLLEACPEMLEGTISKPCDSQEAGAFRNWTWALCTISSFPDHDCFDYTLWVICKLLCICDFHRYPMTHFLFNSLVKEHTMWNFRLLETDQTCFIRSRMFILDKWFMLLKIMCTLMLSNAMFYKCLQSHKRLK